MEDVTLYESSLYSLKLGSEGLKYPVCQLIVEEDVPEIISGLETCFVMEGQTATITCELSRSNEEIQWFKEGKLLEISERVNIVHEGVMHHLIIQDVNVHDEAEYSAKVHENLVTTRLVVEGMLFLGLSSNFLALSHILDAHFSVHTPLVNYFE